MITVVDAYGFFDKLNELAKVRDQPDADGTEEADRTISDLMVEQVEFANVVMINKKDLLLAKGKSGERELQAVEGLVRKLNPTARVIVCERGQVPLKEILNTGKFDLEKAQRSRGWILELKKPGAYMCVCMCACMCVCMYARACACKRIWARGKVLCAIQFT